MMKYDTVLQQAERNKSKYQAFVKKVKRVLPKNTDILFKDSHESVFAEVDCLACANCCKTTSPLFRPSDIERLSKHLRIKYSDFQKQYLKQDEDGDWVLKGVPCPFLEKDNSCNVYAERPKACREYPHTDRKKMYQVMDITYRNIFICPAVSKIIDKVAEKMR